MHFSKILLGGAAATIVTAAPAAVPSKPFTLISLKSATSLHFLPVQANDLLLKLNAPVTASPTPAGINAFSYTNGTLFNLQADGTVTMAIGTTGVQYLYWSPQTDIAQITPGHTDFIPNGGISSFYISGSGSDYQLNFKYGPPYACGAENTLFFGGAALNTANCQEIGLLVNFVDDYNTGVYQYI